MRTFLEIDPTFEDALHAAGLKDFDAFLRVRGGQPASRHQHRETVPLELSIEGSLKTFFLKRDFKVAPKHAFWPMFRGRRGCSQPAWEWRMCRELKDAGLPVMSAVAYGERRRYGLAVQGFILVEAVPMRYTLENWLVPGFPKAGSVEPRMLDRLLYETGQLVGRLFGAGFDWPDLSAKHIYASPQEKDHCKNQWDFRLIDVERMRRRPADTSDDDHGATLFRSDLVVSVQRLLDSLSPLSFDRFDFRRLCSGVCRGARLYSKRFGKERVQTDRSQLLEYSGVVHRPRLPDDYEHPRAAPLEKQSRIFVSDRIAPMLRSVGIHDFEDIFQYDDGENLWKPGLDSYRDRIRMVVRNGAGGSRTFYLKRYRRPPLGAQLRRIWECGRKKSTGWREIHFAKHLARIGIPAIRGVAYGQEMNGFWESKSFGMTEEVPGRSLESIVDGAMRDPCTVPAWEERREIIRQLALITRLMHENLLFHRDLYLCHIFLGRNKDAGIVLRLIDLARMISKPRRRERWAIKDLAALNYSAPRPLITRADRLRFLYYYESSPVKPRLRSLVSRVMARTRRMARHDANRARRG